MTNKIENQILVLGDSHAREFFIELKKELIPNLIIRAVGGATTQGLVNPNTKTNALIKFKKSLEDFGKVTSHCIINVGEVDCGFVIWYRQQKYNDSIKNQFNRSLNNYFEFIENNLLNFYPRKNIIICGVIPPTIKDNTDKKFLAGARSEVKASQIERTKLTKKYNEKLLNYAKQNQLNYISIFDDVISKKDALINDYYLNDNKFDHHLSASKCADLWFKKLKPIF